MFISKKELVAPILCHSFLPTHMSRMRIKDHIRIKIWGIRYGSMGCQKSHSPSNQVMLISRHTNKTIQLISINMFWKFYKTRIQFQFYGPVNQSDSIVTVFHEMKVK